MLNLLEVAQLYRGNVDVGENWTRYDSFEADMAIRGELDDAVKVFRMVTGKNVRIHHTARFESNKGTIRLGSGTIVNRNARLEGEIVIGREGWIGEDAWIGGGSAHAGLGRLVAGDFLHLGFRGHINTARDVTIGDEVGMRGYVYTHGAWRDELAGGPCAFAPVVIEDRCWLPSATVLPGVKLPEDVVVAAGSVVRGDWTSHVEGAALIGGVPARFIRAIELPTSDQRLVALRQIVADAGLTEEARVSADAIELENARFRLRSGHHSIEGDATPEAEALRNELRRHGIRFRFVPVQPEGAAYYRPVYKSWKEAGW